MNRHILVFLFALVLVLAPAPVTLQPDEPSPYMSEDWLFEAPFNMTTPDTENVTPAGVWLYNITIPVINGSNQFWIWFITYTPETVVEVLGENGAYYNETYTLTIDTSLFTGWVMIRVYAYVMPAWMHGSFWELYRWFYVGH